MRTHPGRSNVCTYKFCSTHAWANIDFEVVKMNVESEKLIKFNEVISKI